MKQYVVEVSEDTQYEPISFTLVVTAADPQQAEKMARAAMWGQDRIKYIATAAELPSMTKDPTVLLLNVHRFTNGRTDINWKRILP